MTAAVGPASGYFLGRWTNTLEISFCVEALEECLEHYHRETDHQNLEKQLLERAPPSANPGADIQRTERLGGLLNYYHRETS